MKLFAWIVTIALLVGIVAKLDDIRQDVRTIRTIMEERGP